MAVLAALTLFRAVALTAATLGLAPQAPDITLTWQSQTGEIFQVEHRTDLLPGTVWQLLSTNVPAAVGTQTTFIHSNALANPSGFYRIARHASPFTFTWDGTNFLYADSQRAFSGIMLKPAGAGPFGGVIINHGAGGTPTGYSLAKAREMSAWGLVCIGPALTHVQGGETNAVNMGNCPENIARAVACADVLGSLPYVDTNRLAIFGHSMGAFATIGDAAALVNRIRSTAMTAGGVLADSTPDGVSNATPTVSEASPVRAPFLMLHCDADPVVPASRSQLFQQVLNTNSVVNQRILISSNSIPNPNNWHNIHNDPNINTLILTNTRAWFQTHGVAP
jgi:dienelactone hydrolase